MSRAGTLSAALAAFFAYVLLLVSPAPALAQDQQAGAQPSLFQEQPSWMPAGFSWNLSEWTPKVYGGIPSVGIVPDPVAPYADVGITYQALFSLFDSTTLTNPGATYYVAPSTATPVGSDSNNCTASATPCASCQHALTLANAGPAHWQILIEAGLYYRLNTCAGSTTTVRPTTSGALIAYGGRAVECVCDSFTAADDGSGTNTYNVTVASVSRVVDLQTLNQFGNYTDMANCASVALTRVTGNCWFLTGSTLSIKRADGAAVTTTNTRIYRPNTANLDINVGINLAVWGQTTADGFDFEGAQTGAFNAQLTADPGADYGIIVANSTFKYAGGVGNTGAYGFEENSWRGLVACFNCRFDENWTDGPNDHGANWTTPSYQLLVNGSASDNGRPGTASDQCATNHESTVMMVLAMVCANNHGGTIRSVNAAQAWVVGTVVHNDLGDIVLNGGGATPPTAFETSNTAQYWLDYDRIDMPGAGYSLVAGSGSAINYRNMAPFRQPTEGAGTIAPY